MGKPAGPQRGRPISDPNRVGGNSFASSRRPGVHFRSQLPRKRGGSAAAPAYPGAAASDPPVTRFWVATERAPPGPGRCIRRRSRWRRLHRKRTNRAQGLPWVSASRNGHPRPWPRTWRSRTCCGGISKRTGPIEAAELAARVGVRTGLVEIGLAALEAEGFVLRGRFEDSAAAGVDQYCARRLLARIHSDSQSRRRASVEPVTAQDLMRFLLEWQGVAVGSQREGAPGVAQVIEQLQGFDLAAGAWESEVLAARVRGYRPEWLDPHCLSGQVSWLRAAPQPERTDSDSEPEAAGARRVRSTSRSTPLSLVLRADLPWLLQAHRKDERSGGKGARAKGQSAGIGRKIGRRPISEKRVSEKRVSEKRVPETRVAETRAPEARVPETRELLMGDPAEASDSPGNARDARPLAEQILDLLTTRGALFHAELVGALDARPVDVEAALWDLVARGRVGADGFQALRSLLGSREGRSKARAGTRARRGLRRGLAAGATAGVEGRWCLVPAREAIEDMDGLAEAIAEQLLIRWGVVFRDVVARENLALPWREIVWRVASTRGAGLDPGGAIRVGLHRGTICDARGARGAQSGAAQAAIRRAGACLRKRSAEPGGDPHARGSGALASDSGNRVCRRPAARARRQGGRPDRPIPCAGRAAAFRGHERRGDEAAARACDPVGASMSSIDRVAFSMSWRDGCADGGTSRPGGFARHRLQPDAIPGGGLARGACRGAGRDRRDSRRGRPGR